MNRALPGAERCDLHAPADFGQVARTLTRVDARASEISECRPPVYAGGHELPALAWAPS